MNKNKLLTAISSALFLANFFFPSTIFGQQDQFGTQEITADGETITLTAPGNITLGTAQVSLTTATNTLAYLEVPGTDVSSSEYRLAVEDLRGVADDGNFTVDAIASTPFTDLIDPTNTILSTSWSIATTTTGTGALTSAGPINGGTVIYEAFTVPPTGGLDVEADFDISGNATPDGSDASEFAIPAGGVEGTLNVARTLLDAPLSGGRIQRVATAVIHKLSIPAGTAPGVYSGRVTYTLTP